VSTSAELGTPAPASPVTPSSAPSSGAGPAHEVRKYRFIDALRGYAVLLVITCHAGYMFPNLPYPVKKLTEVGWHGVQLFFLISCVTLMMSWRSDERKGIASAQSFWARRFFRIAPMYYLAAAFYFVIETPSTGFNPLQLFASLAFFNAWHPLLIPTVPDRWMVVPGGWSIGVEFTFYLLFPLIVTSVRSIKASLVFFIFAVAIACLSNTAIHNLFITQYGAIATNNFVYFWLPNQLPIFALGTVLFFVVDHLRSGLGRATRLFQRAPNFTILACFIVFSALAENSTLFDSTFSFTPRGLLPFLLLAAILFMIFAITLALNDKLLWVNPVICSLGEVSFSAYILHFFVLHRLGGWLPFADPSHAGYAAIGSLAALWFCTLVITFGISKLTYEFIERPAIKVGARISRLLVGNCLAARRVTTG
jgi:peptidoglycan/LPS O-acetylase OafA/YrhL